MEDVIRLKSTHRGLTGRYVSAGLWTAFNLLLVRVLVVVVYRIFAKYDVYTIGEYWDLSRFAIGRNHQLAVFFAALGIGLFALLAFGNICNIIGCFYRAKETLVVDKARHLIAKYHYDFPYDKDVSELRFDRVVKVRVSQGMFDRLLYTGTLTIKTLTYANADTIESERSIRHIKDPYGAKERIKAGLPEYTGLKVRLDKGPDAE